MSHIEKLIAEKCPNGVEFRRLGDKSLFDFHYGKGNKIPEDIGGQYDVYGANGVVSHIDEYNCEDVCIIGHIGAVGLVRRCKGKCFVTYNGTIANVVDRSKVDIQYLYYLLLTLNLPSYKKGSQPFLSVSDFENIEIPVPPIEIQEEIVRILDTFTELETKLLEELDERKKQYEYYLQELMNFSDCGYEMKTVGELFDIRNGLSKGKEFFGKGRPIINFTDVFHNRWMTAESIKGKVDVTSEEIKRFEARMGDVFFTRTSETKEEIGMSSTLIEEIDGCVFSGFVLRARPITDLLLPKFCAYYFSTYDVRRQIIQYASFTTRATTTGPKLGKIIVPIVPKEKQIEIIEKLDLLNILCNDSEKGLPAEIAARHKQYEYYREKLFTFERKAV